MCCLKNLYKDDFSLDIDFFLCLWAGSVDPQRDDERLSSSSLFLHFRAFLAQRHRFVVWAADRGRKLSTLSSHPRSAGGTIARRRNR